MDRNKEDPAARDLQEWGEQQYVEGYYTGGRVPPFYTSPWRSRFGYGLLLVGALGLVGIAFSVLTGGFGWDTLAALAVPALVVALLLIAGIRLLRQPLRS